MHRAPCIGALLSLVLLATCAGASDPLTAQDAVIQFGSETVLLELLYAYRLVDVRGTPTGVEIGSEIECVSTPNSCSVSGQDLFTCKVNGQETRCYAKIFGHDPGVYKVEFATPNAITTNVPLTISYSKYRSPDGDKSKQLQEERPFSYQGAFTPRVLEEFTDIPVCTVSTVVAALDVLMFSSLFF